MTSNRRDRIATIAEGLLFLTLSLGFAVHCPWVTLLWQFGDDPMTDNLFAALLASFGVGSIAVALMNQPRAAIGGALSIAVAFTLFPVLTWCFSFFGRASGLRWHGLVLGIVAAIALGSLKSYLAQRREPRPAGIGVWLSVTLALLAAATGAAGVALLAGMKAILPWHLSDQSELLFGAIFIGLAVDCAYVAVSGEACGCQALLIGQITYSAAIFCPLLRIVETTDSNNMLDAELALTFAALTACVSIFALVRGLEGRAQRSPIHCDAGHLSA
jgi:hypothetical protein